MVGADERPLRRLLRALASVGVHTKRACRGAMAGADTLVLVEQLLDEGPDPVRTAFSDLNMLVNPGGQERTTAEYRALLAHAGFRLTRTVPTGTAVLVLEASPV